MKLSRFKQCGFLAAVKELFRDLKVPVNYIADEPTIAKHILKDTYKDNNTFQLIDDVYFVGMIDDAAFKGNTSPEISNIKSDYDGILIFGITLNQRENNLLPTRSQLAEISRAFNREFYYTPVVLVFKYTDDQSDYIAFSNTERQPYKQSWREGEKAGKVSLLRDIDINNPHRGHEDIISQLQIPVSGRNAVDSFEKLYAYWQEVFNVSVLNKKFYQELSNWYFWAVKHVTFPSKPTMEDVVRKTGEQDQDKLQELIQEHNATNVIRLLTRLLFIWFIKEKKLIPEELFDLDSLQKDILNEISPYHEDGMFKEANRESVYYKAILQNLFFATLNCPIEPDDTDKRVRQFRGDEQYGKHRGVDWMMRYKKYFKDPEAFLELMNKTVPFLNGGLFECLDDKTQNKYIDGFSDNMTQGEELIVPDYLFFGIEEHVDLSDDYGVKNRSTRQAAVKGLINILKSYKFTIAENTPIEEDVALDPELLGRVFENLLASYNPETKTTARKQTGSYYTPREIVNYMVDESLIAYLKNAVTDWNMDEKELDEKLHALISFDPGNPFSEDEAITNKIIHALDNCKILDPACGSGAFPMGALQKMVHILQKLDPENKRWKELQLNKAVVETEKAYDIDDREERKERILEIENSFDERTNDPDYARKLYLIENCIYGVDIQPIATQIAKLRFFISLVVDQIPGENPVDNFGIRPLPNLETRFVTANTLIGIKKPESQISLFDTVNIMKLEDELKNVRHKLFGARTKETKLKYRQKDEELRKTITEELKKSGWPNETAEKLAEWNPYDQNLSSPFFDLEWMFDISDWFDVIIGNPPYINIYKIESNIKRLYNAIYDSAYKKYDIYVLFFEFGFRHLKEGAILALITSNKFFSQPYGFKLRKSLIEKKIKNIINFRVNVFDATVDTAISIIENTKANNTIFNYSEVKSLEELLNFENITGKECDTKFFDQIPEKNFRFSVDKTTKPILDEIDNNSYQLTEICYVNYGCRLVSKNGKKKKDDYIFAKQNNSNSLKPFIEGQDIRRYEIIDSRFVDYSPSEHYLALFPELFTSNKIVSKDVVGKSGVLQMAIDYEGFYNDHTIVNAVRWCDLEDVTYNNVKSSLNAIKISTSKQFTYEVLLGLLSSNLAYWYFDMLYNIDLHFYPATLQRMPIYKGKIPVYFEFLIKALLHNIGYEFQNIIDAIIFNLYFPEHMIEREINVLELVEKDVKTALQEREFVNLSDTEKEAVIEELHQTWSNPENEVVKRISQFKEKSPDILKPILES